MGESIDVDRNGVSHRESVAGELTKLGDRHFYSIDVNTLRAGPRLVLFTPEGIRELSDELAEALDAVLRRGNSSLPRRWDAYSIAGKVKDR